MIPNKKNYDAGYHRIEPAKTNQYTTVALYFSGGEFGTVSHRPVKQDIMFTRAIAASFAETLKDFPKDVYGALGIPNGTFGFAVIENDKTPEAKIVFAVTI